MPTLVALPKDIIKTALDSAISLRRRQLKIASNPLIIQALEQEITTIHHGINTLETIPEPKSK